MRMHEEGREVVRRILELRDSGCAYREIREDAGVHHRDGRKLSISTIQIIVKNREEYEKEGL
jgi:intein-encoded DNA endonuclease-like protein